MRTSFARFLASIVLAAGLIFAGASVRPARAVAAFHPSKVSLQLYSSGLTSPVFITNAGDGSARLFVVEQAGAIRILKNGTLLPTPFLDIHAQIRSGGEQGLLALAFHPSYLTNGEFYVAYTAPRPGDATGSVVTLERFTVSANPDVADPNTGLVVLTVDHPQCSNHNGGTLAFGKEGYLYWSVGDGAGTTALGCGGDPLNNAQNLNVLLGKMLRLDIDHADPGRNYAIPSGNPFKNTPNARGEIWAYGLRNPFRTSFDRQTGDLWIADVGQSQREEVDFQPASSTGGENYGWHVMEGTLCYSPSSGCNTSGKVLPVVQYDHMVGCAITGGYRYRGARFPPMQGVYFYGDYCTGVLFALSGDPIHGWSTTQFADTPYNISTFGEDEAGELYLANYSTGNLYRFCYASSVDASVVGTLAGTLNPCTAQAVTQAYAGVNGGPVRVASSIGAPVVASERVAYTPNRGATWTSYSEAMGLPASQLSDTYVFPWYNSVSLSSQISVANVGGSPTTITVAVGGVQVDSYSLLPGASTRVKYPGQDTGPVTVHSTGGIPIVASERVAYTPDAGAHYTSYSELMGLPSAGLTNTYYFPWYNSVNLSSQISMANVGASSTSITITIGGSVVDNYTLAQGESRRVKYPGLNTGPVRVQSSGGMPIIVSERVAFSPDGGTTFTGFSELLGLPSNQLATSYTFPWYNSVNHSMQISVSNVGSSSTLVRVTVGGALVDTYTLAAGGSKRVKYPGLNAGPVLVRSMSSVPIIASERTSYTPDAGVTYPSFSEMLGLPSGLLTDTYVFPWYNNVNLNTEVRFGVP